MDRTEAFRDTSMILSSRAGGGPSPPGTTRYLLSGLVARTDVNDPRRSPLVASQTSMRSGSRVKNTAPVGSKIAASPGRVLVRHRDDMGEQASRPGIADRPAEAPPSVPHADHAVVARGGDEPVARIELDGPDGPVMAVVFDPGPGEGHVPGLDDLLDEFGRGRGAADGGTGRWSDGWAASNSRLVPRAKRRPVGIVKTRVASHRTGLTGGWVVQLRQGLGDQRCALGNREKGKALGGGHREQAAFSVEGQRWSGS